jgi:PTH1 family peptidyl-tRNA hydrolase
VYIVLGLGNPGVEYENTRHNVGYRVVERIASENRVKFKISRGTFQYAIIKDKSEKNSSFIIAKPLTFMNLSGIAAKDLLEELSESVASLIVVHDDIDLDIGVLKIKKDGGSGGHKGVESIIKTIGSKDFIRIKIGVGRPRTKDEVIDYVLTPFKRSEKEIIDNMVIEAIETIYDFINQGFEYAANRHNG